MIKIKGIIRPNCYKMFCSDKSITIKIGNEYFVCPRQGGTMKINSTNHTGFIMCPDYNSICTANNWCNDPLVCIEKKITADESSYIYKYSLRDSTEKSNYLNGLSFTYLFLLIVMIFI